MVFMPSVWCLLGRTRCQLPRVGDLIFVRGSRADLDQLVASSRRLRYLPANGDISTPSVVPSNDMERFIHAVSSTPAPIYYLPNEITPDMCDRKVRVIGGSLSGYEGMLLRRHCSSTRRILIELPGYLVAAVRIEEHKYVALTDD